ncbi:hypothetical protein KG089_00585 [Carnobacteriaceae bacterium zg-ZUI252]|nr:hypothetical protein [Carnobacteriaceae bacterium zg-ZUI252]
MKQKINNSVHLLNMQVLLDEIKIGLKNVVSKQGRYFSYNYATDTVYLKSIKSTTDCLQAAHEYAHALHNKQTTYKWVRFYGVLMTILILLILLLGLTISFSQFISNVLLIALICMYCVLLIFIAYIEISANKILLNIKSLPNYKIIYIYVIFNMINELMFRLFILFVFIEFYKLILI